MRIYDECIEKELSLLKPHCKKVWLYKDDADTWEDGGNNDLIFASDTAFELGGDDKVAVSEQMMTESPEYEVEDSVELYGPDLNEITGNINFAKIVLVKVARDSFTEDGIYDRIRGIQYTKYHIHPKGYMSRVSATAMREQVRVSKGAVKAGISFEKVGMKYIAAYKKYPQVEAVKIIFITEPSFDYEALLGQVKKSEAITAALDHALKDITMNCNSCSVKEICDEVEGMRELHFANAKG